MQFLPSLQRLRCAALIAMSGGAVAQAMTLWGGQLARFPPPLPVLMSAAVAGAGLAGVLLADAFGRRGCRGAIWSAVAWPVVTGLGGMAGASVLALDPARGPASMLANALKEGAPLGFWAVADGIATSPTVLVIWLVAGVAVHHGVRVERAPLVT